MRQHPKGYIALISVLLISVALLVAVASLSFSGYLNRFIILDAEAKDESLAYAEACASSAIGEVTKNSSYTPPAPPANELNIGTGKCSIDSVVSAGSNRLINTSATVGKAVTKIQVEFDPLSLNIISWNEIP